MWIMVAGPYRSGAAFETDRQRNLRTLNIAALEILRPGHVPVVGVNLALPVVEAARPASYEEIMLPLSVQPATR